MDTPTESPVPARFLLSPQERERFAAWLENEAMTSRAIAEQMENMDSPISKDLARREKIYAAAAITVASKLRSIVEYTSIG